MLKYKLNQLFFVLYQKAPTLFLFLGFWSIVTYVVSVCLSCMLQYFYCVYILSFDFLLLLTLFLKCAT